jgi:hypothetical protein
VQYDIAIEPATPHHLIYKGWLNDDDPEFTMEVCEWYHKVITKTAFIKTMNSLFDTNWANYKEYLKQTKHLTVEA